MKIGEIVEILIREKDKYRFGDFRKEAIEEACNLLDRLPSQEEAITYEPLYQVGEGEFKTCKERKGSDTTTGGRPIRDRSCLLPEN